MKLIMRSPQLNDAAAAADMFRKFELHIENEASSTAEQLEKTWQFPGFSLKDDARLITDEEGRFLGYTAVWNDTKPHASNFIIQKFDPEFMGTEVEKKLMDWAEEKARENITKAPEDAEVFMGMFVNSSESKKLDSLNRRGFSQKRYFWRMGIDLDAPIAEPQLPEGITIETHAERNNLVDIIKCDRDCFKDHWGYMESPLEEEIKEWEHWIKTEPYYDPEYWYLACHEGEIVALCLCMNGMTIGEEIGYLDSVCVRKDYRKKGLASAMLRHSFRELKKAGRSKAYLHVDASSLTGATRLYEGVGMKENKNHVKMEKILRPGKSYRTESI